MESLGKCPPLLARPAAFVLAALAFVVPVDGGAIAESAPPLDLADCILTHIDGAKGDGAAQLIADSCAEKYPDTAPVRTKPLFSDADSDLPAGVDAFDGQWIWRAKFPGKEGCFPTRIEVPIRIEYGILKGSIFLGNLGDNAVEGTVRPTGRAQFWGTSGHNLINFEGEFSGDRGMGKMSAQSDKFACQGGSWIAIRATSDQVSGN
jgi:hypothetical protein